MKLLIVSNLSPYALANAYIRSIKSNFPTIQLTTFDILKEQQKYIKLKPFGVYFHRFVPIEAWTRKVNRELITAIQQSTPDAIVIFGNSPVMYGTYMYIRAHTTAKVMLYWPDPFNSLEQNQMNAAPFTHVLATFSRAQQPAFKLAGYHHTTWLPFAFDQYYMGNSSKKEEHFKYDVSFIGGWRPEREELLEYIVEQFPNLNIAVRGLFWKREVKSKKLKQIINPKPLYGQEFADFFRQSKININLMDNTAPGAANMRFFEIQGSGGLQLSSACEDMSSVFKDKEHVLYFKTKEDAATQIEWVLSHENQAKEIRQNGHTEVLKNHTYKQRVEKILETFDF